MASTPLHRVVSEPNDLLSQDWVRLQLDLRKWMSGWVDDLIQRHVPLPWRNGHDEAIFARTLPGFYMLSGYAPALEFCDKLALDLIHSKQVEACDCFLTKQDAEEFGHRKLVERFHGYPAKWSCLCHGPENYAWFLNHTGHVSKSREVVEALADIAEHIGNFRDDVPAWYDWENHRFRSCHLGTKLVRDSAPYDYETHTHFRLMTVAFNSYALTGDQRYLDVVCDWMDKWAQVILESNAGKIPCNLYPVSPELVDELYGEFGKQHYTPVSYELGHMLLDAYRATESGLYLSAAKKMISGAIDLKEWPMGLLAAKYRALSGDVSFDDAVISYAESSLIRDSEVPGLFISIDPPSESVFEGNDYVTVDKESKVTKDDRGVALMACAYLMSGDCRYAESAMRLAWRRFWASWYLWDGREFGCRGSWTARNGVAMHNVIPALALPSTGGFTMLEGEIPWMEVIYRQQDGRPGLPEHVASLYRPAMGGRPPRVTIVNTSDAAVSLECKPGRSQLAPSVYPDSGEGWIQLIMEPNSAVTASL